MEYTVQVDLNGERVAPRIAEIWRWVKDQKIEPPMFRYRMTDEGVVLRLEFHRLSHASSFRMHFAGAMALQSEFAS